MGQQNLLQSSRFRDWGHCGNRIWNWSCSGWWAVFLQTIASFLNVTFFLFAALNQFKVFLKNKVFLNVSASCLHTITSSSFFPCSVLFLHQKKKDLFPSGDLKRQPQVTSLTLILKQIGPSHFPCQHQKRRCGSKPKQSRLMWFPLT